MRQGDEDGVELIQRSGLSKEIWPPAWAQVIFVLLMFSGIVALVLTGVQ